MRWQRHGDAMLFRDEFGEVWKITPTGLPRDPLRISPEYFGAAEDDEAQVEARLKRLKRDRALRESSIVRDDTHPRCPACPERGICLECRRVNLPLPPIFTPRR